MRPASEHKPGCHCQGCRVAVRNAYLGEDTRRDRAYLDNEGDICGFRYGSGGQWGVWSYIGPRGTFSNWDVYDELPDEFGPYVELSEQASNAVLRAFRKGHNHADA